MSLQDVAAQTPSTPPRATTQTPSEDLDDFVADKSQMDPAVPPAPKPRLLKNMPPPVATPGVSSPPQSAASPLPPTVTVARTTTRTAIHIPTGVIAGVVAVVAVGLIVLVVATGRQS